MVDILLALLIGVFSTAGGLLIKDLKALSIFTTVTATAAFLIAHITNMPATVLGLLGLAVAAVKIGRAGKKVVERKIVTYRSRRRLKKLEEAVKTLPENILDVVPRGGVRSIHPNIVNLVVLINNAYVKGYTIEEPSWFREVRRYLATVGPNFVADKTKILSEYEIVDLD
ncbi:MAG: hypothetical protein QW680_07975 [Pyrobaculum sp.]